MTQIAITVFIIGLVLTFPIAVAIALGAVAPGLIDPSVVTDTVYVIRAMVVGVDSTPILAIPLFMLSGTLMARGQISRKIFDVFAYFLGTRTAGLPCAVIITCLFYGAISGSGPATCAAVGSMTVPLLLSLGYDRNFCGAIIATAGGLGLIIPPSISFINFALVTGTSVTALFAGGILPGIVIALFLMFYAWVYCRRHGEDKEKIAANYQQLAARGLWPLLADGFWALLTPVIILGGIYSGWFTPTEAACVSVVYALIVAVFIYQTIPPGRLIPVLCEAVKSFAPLCILIAVATAFGRILTLANAPQQLAVLIGDSIESRIAFLLLLNGVLLLLGMFIDGAPAILILSPLLLPVASSYGIDPVHLGLVMVANLTIGLATPPFGLNLFVASGIVDSPVLSLGRATIPFIVVNILALLVITFIPWLTLVLAY